MAGDATTTKKTAATQEPAGGPVNTEQLVAKIRACPTLPSLPAIAMQVVDLAQREEVDIAEIARIISKDPALSSKILRTVNSSFYGRAQSISTISHALVILGLQSVKTLVLGFSLVTNLTKNKSKGFKHLTYWRRSIYAATAARTIASKIQLVQQEEVFLAALLQDIGMLVLDQVLGEKYGAIHERCESHADLCAVERAELGMTHADVAGVLAEMWKLPPLLRVPMAAHHSMGDAGETPPAELASDAALKRMTELVYLSGRCADVFVDENAAAAIAHVRKFVLETYQIAEADCDAMLDDICKKTKEIAPMFEISLGSVDSYEAVLKKANEALVELTLRSQQQASTLQVQNQELQKKATTDALTGLANRATFDEFLATQFGQAGAGGKPLSLLMLDIDKFKSVNDKHGHPAGDAVIKYIGRLLKTAARVQDVAARYGGEEMALVLPGTSRNTAAAIAETICKAISAKAVPIGEGKTLAVTASLGVACFEAGGVLAQPAHLIKAADLALYTAKKSGRNCVKVFTAPAKGKAAA